MKEPFLINPMERIKIPKGLFSRPGIGNLLKSLVKSKPTSKKAINLRSALRRKGFRLTDKKTWGKSFVAKPVKKSKKQKKFLKRTTKLAKMSFGSPKKSSKRKTSQRKTKRKSSWVGKKLRELETSSPRMYAKGRGAKVPNPLLIAGANPFKMKGGGICMAKKKKKHNPSKKHSGRKFRRNPTGGFLSGSVLSNPKALLTPVLVGIGAKVVTDRVPGFVGTTDPLTKGGVQFGIAVGGSLLVGRFVSKEAALMWLVVAMSTALSNLANHFLLDGVLGPVLNAYPNYSGMGRFLPKPITGDRMLPEPRNALGSLMENGDPVGYPFSNGSAF